MSTHAAIAVPSGQGWRGRYHHFDGYPSKLGRMLHELYGVTFGRDLASMTSTLLDQHPAGWATIIRPQDLCGNRRVYRLADFDRAGYAAHPDGSHPRCYCHGERAEYAEELVCRCPTEPWGCGPLDIEWAYVLGPHGVTVFASLPHPADPGTRSHRPVGFAFWNTRHVDWRAIEDQVASVRKEARNTSFPS